MDIDEVAFTVPVFNLSSMFGNKRLQFLGRPFSLSDFTFSYDLLTQ
jgi:hypothetical protein